MFRKISIQTDLINKAEALIEKIGGYRSIAEFVSEALRLRIEELEKNRAKEGG